MYISVNIDRYSKNAGHSFFKYSTSQQDPVLLLPSIRLQGWGHRGRVKVTSGRRGVGQGLGKRGEGGGYIKTDRTQVVLYSHCPALGKRKPLTAPAQPTQPFSPSLFARSLRTCARLGQEWQHHPYRKQTGPSKCCRLHCFSSPPSSMVSSKNML